MTSWCTERESEEAAGLSAPSTMRRASGTGAGGGLSGQRVYTPLYGILNIVCKCWLTHKHKGRKKAAEGGAMAAVGAVNAMKGGAEERDKSLQAALLVIRDGTTRFLT